jgi:hypothetical protein
VVVVERVVATLVAGATGVEARAVARAVVMEVGVMAAVAMVEEVKVVALEAAREHPLRTGTHPP